MLSKPEYGVSISKDLMPPMRDGVRLASDVYRPALDGEPITGSFPTILQRTIYDKDSARFVSSASYFCKRGYTAVVRIRGRVLSHGQ